MTNRDRRFYPLLGPFLARRAVIRAIGAPPYDEAQKIWCIAHCEQGVLGFVGLRVKISTAHIVSLYVLPRYRRSSIGTHLLERCCREAMAAECTTMTAVVRKASVALFLNIGFTIRQELVNYVKVVKSC